MLIAIGARKRTGKGTVAKLLKAYSKNPLAIIDYSFIQLGRDYVRKLLPDLVENEENRKEEYRQVMIDVVKPILDVDSLAYTKELVTMVNDTNAIFIASDLRRLCEYEYCKEHLSNMCKFILVENPRIEKVESYGEGSIDDHSLWDVVINNDGTLKDLEYKVLQVVRDLNI